MGVWNAYDKCLRINIQIMKFYNICITHMLYYNYMNTGNYNTWKNEKYNMSLWHMAVVYAHTNNY